MAKYILLLHVIFLSSFEQFYAQKNSYAIEILEEICSEKYQGRGYDYGSDKKVSEYIIRELKRNRVKSVNKDYKQEFSIQVNTFPGMLSVNIGGRTLEPGSDFVIAGYSASLSGTFNIVRLGPEIINDSIRMRSFIQRDFSKTALLIDTLGIGTIRFKEAYDLITQENILKAKLIIRVEDQNLMYTPMRNRKDFVSLSIKRGSLPFESSTITVEIKSEYFSNYLTSNIIGFIRGKSDSSIVLTAHYDHIGKMGLSTYFPGANDNGSGVAMLLNIAKYFSKQKKPKYSIVLIFFSGEELGILGSKYYTENPLFPLSKIKFLLNIDMVGSGEKGIKVVNGTIFKKEFNRLTEINKRKKLLETISSRGPAANSDHYYFYEKGVKCFFIYTLGDYKEYHNIYDRPNILPLTEFDDLSLLIIEFIKSF